MHALWSLRLLAFCHGLAFHACFLQAQLQNVTVAHASPVFAFRGVFGVLAVRTLAQILTESWSGRLVERYGCWHVLQWCTHLRTVGLIILLALFWTMTGKDIEMDINHSVWDSKREIAQFYLDMTLMVIWAICEGVSDALCSGTDVAFVHSMCSHQKESEQRDALSWQHRMWPAAMFVANCVNECIRPSFRNAVLGSIASLIVAEITLFMRDRNTDHAGTVHTQDVSCSSRSTVSNTRQFLWNAVAIDFSNWTRTSALRLSLLYSLMFVINTETMQKLQGLAFPMLSKPRLAIVSFLGSFIGSWLATTLPMYFRSVTPEVAIRGTLVCIASIALMWTHILQSQTPESTLFLLGTCALLSIAWGCHKTSFQCHIFAQLSSTVLTASETVTMLSAQKLATQAAYMVWMCAIVSPALDWRAITCRDVFGVGCFALLSPTLLWIRTRVSNEARGTNKRIE